MAEDTDDRKEAPDKRTILVTGSSKGVGRAVAKALVMQGGCTVIGVSRDVAGLGSLRDECKALPGAFEPLPVDLAGPEGIDRVVQHMGRRRLHGLVNNAGLLVKREWGAWEHQDLQGLFHLNAVVPLLLAQALTPALEGHPPGHVVNIGSMGGFQGSVKFPGLAGYSASKAAAANLTECMAEELKERGVRCNCLCLGAVDTAMLRLAFPGYRAPVGPGEVGEYIAHFVLEGHRLFNGKVLPLALSTP
jgi:NAD(P)-dependent dehydrogenase (short-subunit alcohol dehydrogenase family)